MDAPSVWERLAWRSLSLILAPRRAIAAEFPLLPKLYGLLKNVPASAGDADPQRPAVKRAFHLPGRPAHPFECPAGGVVPLEILFFGGDAATPGRWLDAFAAYLKTAPRAGFDLVEAGAPVLGQGEELLRTCEAPPVHAELRLLSPLPFKRLNGAARTNLDLEVFLTGLRQRAKSLFDLELAPPSTEGVVFQPWHWDYMEIPHVSKSQPGGHVQLYNGCVGPLYFGGDLAGILPWLRLAEAIHAGGSVALNGLGYCRLHLPARPRLDLRLRDAALWRSALAKIQANHDDWADLLAGEQGAPCDAASFCAEFGARVLAPDWRPAPALAFDAPKRVGYRRLEKLPFAELLLHTGLHEALRVPLERTLTQAAFGYRRGRSVQTAVAQVRELIEQGYRYVVEADIEDFFPSIDIDRMESLLDRMLPPADAEARRLLRAVLRAPYLENGALRPRRRGLAQGSPLSPSLANLYLNAFDAALLAADARLVRYADDFALLTREREQAETLLARARGELDALGLKLSADKTRVRRIDQGFRFLGQPFGAALPEESLAELAARPVRKTLYVREPDCFLGHNGDAVEIRQHGRLLDVLPLHGLEQIVVLGRASFSSGLVRKCAGLGVPLAFSLGRRGMASVALDSRRHYATARDHALHYARLSPTERLGLAKAFAFGKIENYRPLIAARYRAGHAELLAAFDAAQAGIEQAADTDEARGYEGMAARKMYAALNEFIKPPAFHFPRRDRDHPDLMNSLLNFGYHLLFMRLNILVRAAGLNPYLGYLHDGDDDYESLVCDIEELFRAPVDRHLVALVNLKIIEAGDFRAAEKGPRLQAEAARRFILRFEELMQSDAGGVSLARAMELQVEALRRYVAENRPLWLFRYKAPRPEAHARIETAPADGDEEDAS
jgi:CRISPR-associated protein Cas1